MKTPIRVLIVDDSGFVRSALASIIKRDPGLEVAGSASNGIEAVEMAQQLKPDVITLDINMPKMDGMEALKKIMETAPTAVLMVSMLTEEGAQATLTALANGAVDYIPKGMGDSPQTLFELESELLEKLKSIGNRSRKKRVPPSERSPERRCTLRREEVTINANVVAIGTSTGGPKALLELMPLIPASLGASGLIVQHMPESFITPFAERLNQISPLDVKVAEDGEQLEPGTFLIAPAHLHLKVRRPARRKAYALLDPSPADSLHRPSVDQMFTSVARAFPGKALGVVLTGMGRDGLEGARALKSSDCAIIAQDENSCVVYGMPRAVADHKLTGRALPLSQIHEYIIAASEKR